MFSGDYIFHIDADEIPNEVLLKQLPQILEINDTDLVWVPRINIVNGIYRIPYELMEMETN